MYTASQMPAAIRDQLVLDSDRHQRAGHTEDESQVVDDHHHDIDRNLSADRRVRPKVDGAVEHVAEREGAHVRTCDGDRHRNAQPAVQGREDGQIDTEGQTVDQTETKKRRRDDRPEPERKPSDDRFTELVESVDEA